MTTPIVPRCVAIIQGHPDPKGSRLCHALADAYVEGAMAAGHQVMRIDLAQLDFPLLRTQQDFETGQLPPTLAPARDAIVAAEHVVIIFPLWLGTMPALVKAFLEQLMRPGIEIEYQKQGFPKQLLKGRSARLVVTMGMPALLYRWYFGGHGLRGFERSVLRFVGMKPVRDTLFGMVQTAGDARRRRWLGIRQAADLIELMAEKFVTNRPFAPSYPRSFRSGFAGFRGDAPIGDGSAGRASHRRRAPRARP